ncbi:hypothetical protein Q8A67_019719 [Cirrhinus molitorella]|uniref:Uncharacterized protein n=1 Tax=Cirrhinus molitorella TaxID=172907 RepID=A0AA88PAG3_9TELE|nr:hypothetical protein Q8A67_019719 [Cirrhinus molitorella]
MRCLETPALATDDSTLCQLLHHPYHPPGKALCPALAAYTPSLLPPTLRTYNETEQALPEPRSQPWLTIARALEPSWTSQEIQQLIIPSDVTSSQARVSVNRFQMEMEFSHCGMVSYSLSTWPEPHVVRAVRYGAQRKVVERPVPAHKMIREAGAGMGRTAEWTSGGRADMSAQQKMNWSNEPSGSPQPNPNPFPIAHHLLIIPIHGLIVPQGSGLLMFSQSTQPPGS